MKASLNVDVSDMCIAEGRGSGSFSLFSQSQSGRTTHEHFNFVTVITHVYETSFSPSGEDTVTFPCFIDIPPLADTTAVAQSAINAVKPVAFRRLFSISSE